ncbi:MAG TPA: V-type ATPase subunit [Spirochaetia bacterium]|nr:V-type ATPase subunit [Spirochaetia bacterium]
MGKTFRYGYIQAKLHALVGDSFIRRDIRPLARGGDVNDLARLVFPDRTYDLPEKALIRKLQIDLDAELFDVIRRILRVLTPSPPVIVHLLRKYEYRTVRALARALGNSPGPDDHLAGSVTLDTVWDLGPFGTFSVPESGELSIEVLDGTAYEWVREALGKQPLFEIEGRLDRQFYTELLELARGVPRSDRQGVGELALIECNLQNYIWILRLRTYFNLYQSEPSKIVPLLVPVSPRFPDRITQALIDIPLDNPDAVRTFRYPWLFQDQFLGDARRVDPSRAEALAELFLYRKAKRYFYQYPFCLGLVYAFCKLKEFEVARVTTILEGIKMSLSEQEILEAAGSL